MTLDRTQAVSPAPVAGKLRHSVLSRVSCAMVQPLLSRVAQWIAARRTSLFARLGPHQTTDFLIDPLELPFALHLPPDPNALVFRAVPRDAAPQPGALIRGKFLLLLELIDAEQDGDAAFFFAGPRGVWRHRGGGSAAQCT